MPKYSKNQSRTWGIGPLNLVLWQCILLHSPPAGANEHADQHLTELVTSAIDSNYSMIESAKLTIRETSRDRSVTHSKETLTQLPGGGTIKVFRSPKSISTLHFLLRGKNLRCERRAGDSVDGEIMEVFGFKNGSWTQYVPSITTAWLRLTEELSSTFPLDPRQNGSTDIRRRLSDILREDQIVRAEMVRQDSSNMVQIVAKASGGAITTYQFSAKAHFLPTRFYTTWDDGSLLQHVDIEYQPVIDDYTLFPKMVQRRFYEKGKARLPETAGWRQEMVREVLGEIKLNVHINDAELAVSLPPGTRVVNVTRGTVHGMKEPFKERLSWALPLNTLVIVVLLGVIFYRSYRSKSTSP